MFDKIYTPGDNLAILQTARAFCRASGLTFSYTVLYLSLIVLIPLSAVFLKSATSGWGAFWTTITSPQRDRGLSR